jgi:hypothetical protein
MMGWSVCCVRIQTNPDALVSKFIETVVRGSFHLTVPTASKFYHYKITLLRLKRQIGTQQGYSSDLTGACVDILRVTEPG